MTTTSKDNKYLKASTFMNKGAASEAIEECRKLLAQSPDDAQANFIMGAALVTLKKYPDALTPLARAAALQPDNHEYILWYGDTLRQCSYFDKSKELLSRLVSQDPNNDKAQVSLGLIYDAFRQWHQAATYFQKAVELKPSNSMAQRKLGEMLLHLGDTDAALQHAKKALAQDPKDANHYHLLAVIHQAKGDMDTAAGYLRKCIDIDPLNGAAYGEYVRSKKISPADAELINRMEKQLEKGMPAGFRNHFHFALAKSYDDLGEHEKAFHHLQQGNLLLHGQFPVTEFKNDIKGIQKAYKSISISQLQNSGNPSHAPVFVVGMPRSGTTLIDQILSSHSQVHSIGESQEIGFGARDACEEMGIEFRPYNLPLLNQELVTKYAQRYLERGFAETPVSPRLVDKMPANFFNIGYILTLFPNAKIIHSSRHPLDTALSCYFQRFTASIYMEWSNDLTMLGLYYRGYAELMTFWKQRFPEQILDVQYEDMVLDQENSVRRLLDFIGLDWEDACLNFHKSKRVVQTASLWQVRQPLYTSSVSRWRPYAKHLGPLIDALGDILTEADYQAIRDAGLNRNRPSGWLKRLLGRH